jgi:two-component system response regulator
MSKALRSRTIVLVEDNDDDIELTQHALAKAKLYSELVVARSGEEAVSLMHGPCGVASGTMALPALMLLDLKLPGIGGLDVLKTMRAVDATKRMPVVILTTSDDVTDVMDGYDLGVNSYIHKPMDSGDFNRVVDKLGLYWLTINTPAAS